MTLSQIENDLKNFLPMVFMQITNFVVGIIYLVLALVMLIPNYLIISLYPVYKYRNSLCNCNSRQNIISNIKGVYQRLTKHTLPYLHTAIKNRFIISPKEILIYDYIPSDNIVKNQLIDRQKIIKWFFSEVVTSVMIPYEIVSLTSLHFPYESWYVQCNLESIPALLPENKPWDD